MRLLFDENVSPKLVSALVWLDVGNAGTAAIATLLRNERPRLERFETQEETSLLVLSIGPSAI